MIVHEVAHGERMLCLVLPPEDREPPAQRARPTGVRAITLCDDEDATEGAS